MRTRGKIPNQHPRDFAADHNGVPRRQLTLFDSTCIIVGIIIGASIFEAPPLIASQTAGPGWLISIWLAGGFISLMGAICYAELAAAYPQSGGEYVYLTRAYGRSAGFLFAWVSYWIIRPANLGALAYIFARYASRLVSLPLGEYQRYEFTVYALAAVILLTGVHLAGVQTGKWTQNLLTAAKILGLLILFAIGACFIRNAAPYASPPLRSQSAAGFELALILVLFAYGGWNEISLVASEVRHPEKNFLRVLVLGTLTVTGIYLLIQLAFLRALGFEGLRTSQAVATDVVRPVLGSWGGHAISLLICLSCLGAIHGSIFTGARVNYSVGREHRPFAWLGRWSPRLDTPLRSLVVQAVIAAALIVAFGPDRTAFGKLVVFTAPYFYFYFCLAGLAVFVLRAKEPGTPRPYRITLFPLPPILFCVASGFMLYASLRYAYRQAFVEGLWGVLLTAAGLVFIPFDRPIDRGQPAEGLTNLEGKPAVRTGDSGEPADPSPEDDR